MQILDFAKKYYKIQLLWNGQWFSSELPDLSTNCITSSSKEIIANTRSWLSMSRPPIFIVWCSIGIAATSKYLIVWLGATCAKGWSSWSPNRDYFIIVDIGCARSHTIGSMGIFTNALGPISAWKPVSPVV